MDAEGLRETERLVQLGGPAVDVGQEARELDEQHEGREDADDREPEVVEHRVGETRAADAQRDQREQRDGVALREAVADEPMGGVVAAALVDRAPVEQSRDAVTSVVVEDRHRQDQDRQNERRDGRAGDTPASP